MRALFLAVTSPRVDPLGAAAASSPSAGGSREHDEHEEESEDSGWLYRNRGRSSGARVYCSLTVIAGTVPSRGVQHISSDDSVDSIAGFKNKADFGVNRSVRRVL